MSETCPSAQLARSKAGVTSVSSRLLTVRRTGWAVARSPIVRKLMRDAGALSMIPKCVKRFPEKIMLEQRAKAG